MEEEQIETEERKCVSNCLKCVHSHRTKYGSDYIYTCDVEICHYKEKIKEKLKLTEAKRSYLKWLGFNDFEIENTLTEEDVTNSVRYDSFIAGYNAGLRAKDKGKKNELFGKTEQVR